jgi:hypothetical protein
MRTDMKEKMDSAGTRAILVLGDNRRASEDSVYGRGHRAQILGILVNKVRLQGRLQIV